MCAIAGIVGYIPQSKEVGAMMATMQRRGPDGSGKYQNKDCTLLHTRLAIIDPQGGQQPMAAQMAEEQYIIVYNGEIYNTEEICAELKLLGHHFRGHSDTEVVLHAFIQWKEACVDRLNGIFAFAVWCEREQRLFLARDRIGVKPLFYAIMNHCIVFASEVKTILASGLVKPELTREGALQILMLGPGRKPDSGVFNNVFSMEPGFTGWFAGGQLKKTRYWMLTDRENHDSFEETAGKVHDLVLDSIKRQMVSDAPIGTFLSGGLDSSIISAICAKEMSQQGKTLKTFSVDYLNNERYFVSGKFQPDTDTPYITLLQDHLQTEHHWSVFTPEELDAVLENATIARDLPGMADVDFSLLAFCQDIRKEVKVALSGECADEIFGGYPWFRDPEVREREGFPWSQNVMQRAQLLLPHIADSSEAADYAVRLYHKTCAESDILPETDPLERRMKQMVNLNFTWFMQTLLDRKDRMSMYHGLEVRVPFCDYRIAQYLYTVPWKYKDYLGREKGLLRYAVRGLLPDKVLYRKKSPYPKTFDPRYGVIMESRIRDILNSDSPMFSIISRGKLRQTLSEPMTWPWYGQLMGHAQTCAFFVQLDYWLRKYKVALLF